MTAMTNRKKPRVLVFVVAYNAERTIGSVLSRIPASLAEDYDVEILAIDDASRDRTFEIGHQVEEAGSLSLPLRVLFNPINQGYGGNQKIGYHYAIKNDFDFVALVHGDGQYAPEALPDLLKPLAQGLADAVFGSRMLTRGAALRGGMPFYKFIGNKILTWCQNRLLRTQFSEFHSGYRVYSVAALQRVPFDRNTDDFHFDTEIVIQLLKAGMRVRELPIPTYYGNEICHVNGIRYAFNVIKATLKSRIHELSIFYDSKFDCGPERERNARHELKLGYDSPPNVGFLIIRLMLLLGQFNYGKRGILDMTHTRLFTFSSLRQLLEQRGFRIIHWRGIPAPYPVALGNSAISRFLLAANSACLRLLPTLFSYQMFVVVEPRPSLELLLQRAIDESSTRTNKMESASV